MLLRTLAGLPDLDWTLTIAGGARDAVHAHGLQALAEELAIAQRVTFAGELSAAALEALYGRADIFALATWWEGYGMAAAEAMARGLPLAITAGGAIADLVPMEAGAVSPPGDVVSLTKALRRMIFDAEMLREMAAASWAAGQRCRAGPTAPAPSPPSWSGHERGIRPLLARPARALRRLRPLRSLAAALIARLPARPRLIDLGAGTGSLLRWLAPRIGRAQVWTLVDSSREMAEAAFDTIADRADQMGYPITAPSKRTLLVHAPGGAWRIEALIADLAESPANLPLQAADAV